MNTFVRTYPSTECATLSHQRGYVGLSLSSRITKSESQLVQIFEWANDNLESFDILIGDYFHRHNLEDLDGFDEAGAQAEALTGGKSATHLVRDVLDRLELVDVKIRLASDMCKTSLFAEHLAAVNSTYELNDQFRSSIGVATDYFFHRFARARLNAEISYLHSRWYQLEELAVFEMFSDEGYSVLVYPGAHLPVMKDIVAGPLSAAMPKLQDLILVEIGFRSVQ